MAKQGMRRPSPEASHGTESNKRQKFPKNKIKPVPEIQGKAKTGNKKAGLISEPKKFNHPDRNHPTV